MPTPDRTPKDPSPALGRRAMLAGLGLPAGLALSQAFSRSATAAPTQPLERAARGPLRTISAAELRAQQDADITEYYLTDPGQQGVFRHDAQDSSTADNTGTVLVTASGARYKRVFTGGLDVRWFGAVGDGSADDTDAVQNAVDVAQRSIVPVYLPAGDYAITRPISVASHRPGLRMFGDQMSSNSPTLTAHSSVSPDDPLPALILFDDTTIGRFFDFSNLMLNADGKAQYGIYSEKIVASRFHRCFIRGATEAALGIGYGYLNDIEDCEFTKNTGDGIRSVKGDVNVLNIVNCKILNNRGIGINLTSPGHGIRIEGCEIETNDQCGIYVAGGSMAVNLGYSR